MTRVEIIKKAFDYLVFKGVITTRADFADAISYNRTNLSSAMNGNEKYLSDSLMSKISQAFPEFDKNWLLTGEGTMLKVPAATMSPYPADEMVSQASPTETMRDGVNVVTDASALDLSVIPAEVVEEIKAEIKSEEAVPIIPAEIANRTETDVKEYIEDNAAELEHFRPGDMTANADGAEKVQKTSMLPTFVPNDIIFIKFLRDKTKIIDGLTYYFDLRSRPTMIRKVKIEGDKLRLIAQNPDYGDIITTFDDVLNVANIVGLFRKTFGDQYSELESVRRQKDTLIQEQIKQNGEALKTIDRLVTVIEKKL